MEFSYLRNKPSIQLSQIDFFWKVIIQSWSASLVKFALVSLIRIRKGGKGGGGGASGNVYMARYNLVVTRLVF